MVLKEIFLNTCSEDSAADFSVDSEEEEADREVHVVVMTLFTI